LIYQIQVDARGDLARDSGQLADTFLAESLRILAERI